MTPFALLEKQASNAPDYSGGVHPSILERMLANPPKATTAARLREIVTPPPGLSKDVGEMVEHMRTEGLRKHNPFIDRMLSAARPIAEKGPGLKPQNLKDLLRAVFYRRAR